MYGEEDLLIETSINTTFELTKEETDKNIIDQKLRLIRFLSVTDIFVSSILYPFISIYYLGFIALSLIGYYACKVYDENALLAYIFVQFGTIIGKTVILYYTKYDIICLFEIFCICLNVFIFIASIDAYIYFRAFIKEYNFDIYNRFH
jgi:hypothetical protein